MLSGQRGTQSQIGTTLGVSAGLGWAMSQDLAVPCLCAKRAVTPRGANKHCPKHLDTDSKLLHDENGSVFTELTDVFALRESQ